MERARDELSLLQFVVFDSGNRRIAINLDHLIVCRFVFEMPNAEIPEPKDLNKLDIVFHLISETKPLRVSITPDHESLDRNPDYDGEAPLQDLFDSIQKLPSQYVSFYDEDDEEVFIKSADISMISASLSVLGNLDEL
jgi:hypothetical protein